jgi:NAD(P)-dependent dehydrogenase (short-subunit alcohol dehydrogenase family)
MHNSFDIHGKVIIVTGAGGYLGRGYCKALTEAGATVIGWDARAGEGVEQVDITDEAQVERAVAAIVAKHSHIDGLINNAAMNPWPGDPDVDKQFVPYEEYPIALFRKEIDVNLTGMMIVTKHVAPIMMKQKSGSIVNVASEAGVAAHDHRVYQSPGRYKSPAYTASKTAIIGLTRQWAARIGEHGVRVNAFSPGGVYNPAMPEEFMKRFGAMNMLGRMAQPGEYEATMQYLMSDASSFMTGANVVIDGGKTAW